MTQHRHDEFLELPGRSLDQIQVAVGNRIERARVDRNTRIRHEGHCTCVAGALVRERVRGSQVLVEPVDRELLGALPRLAINAVMFDAGITTSFLAPVAAACALMAWSRLSKSSSFSAMTNIKAACEACRASSTGA